MTICTHCGMEINGWGFSDPSNCGDPHSECPIYGINRHDKLIEKFNLLSEQEREDLLILDFMRFVEI